MLMNEMVYKRKSTRKYNMTPLDERLIYEIKAFEKTLKPLNPYIKVETTYAKTEEVKNILPIKAPHYIIISSEPKEGYLTNVGFMFQQMALYLTCIGLGNCWLGMAKPAEQMDTELEFVIILAFGKDFDSPYRELSGFKRKTLSEISDSNDIRLETARLAPSATNSQPWYFVSVGDKVHTYCVKPRNIQTLIYERMNKIDMGIALAHLYFSHGDKFEFFIDQYPNELKGYYYIGSVKV